MEEIELSEEERMLLVEIREYQKKSLEQA